MPVIALAVAGGLDQARDICQRVQQTVCFDTVARGGRKVVADGLHLAAGR